MKVNLKCFSKLVTAETCDYKGSTSYDLDNGQSVEDLVSGNSLPEHREIDPFVFHSEVKSNILCSVSMVSVLFSK